VEKWRRLLWLHDVVFHKRKYKPTDNKKKAKYFIFLVAVTPECRDMTRHDLFEL